MTTQARPLSALDVLGIRYRGSRRAEGDERCLDGFVASAVYWDIGVPVTYGEPEMPEARRLPDEPANLGLICAVIGDAVAAGRAAGRAVLVTGGDCSHAVGVFAGLQRAHGPTARIGLIWLDAHGDFNTPNTTLSGMLGGMPVSVCAGLGQREWRERAGVAAPLPTDRILFVDVRNLYAPEEQLIRATEATIAAAEPGRKGVDFGPAVADLADRCDLLYLHVDSDILDITLVPNHGTREPDGPGMAAVTAVIDAAMATGKVAAYAVVSVYGAGEGREISLASGTELIRAGLASWKQHGMAGA
ncbi:arginase family protein [Oscillochloris sp. ZM17-4]|uniref:arginase family protein n=1 Tax=Oscillochloris sp. ZM17-4 TaxID=2866714 RepID=UPI001C735CAD|nr:arginase family protein [Oscillochloris sp. ZM17-4]MBX0329196.1 arginase family protein [Oscillochloris sp. ZM17-4]